MRNSIFANMPPVVKNLLIINAAILLLGFIIEKLYNIDISYIIGLFYYESSQFKPFQIITHMFMHGGLMHLVFNMYALWMFGQILEKVWGAKRFLIYYLVTGFGAAVIHSLVNLYQAKTLMANMAPDQIDLVINNGYEVLKQGKNYADSNLGQLNLLLNIPTVGASGAVFGILLAFGMLFPNTELFLFFVPIPIKAKYFVIGYGVLELVSGVANRPGDNIAHFAHLGGMIFGFILIKIWGKGKTNVY